MAEDVKQLSPAERVGHFRDRAKKIEASFAAIKANPMNLNLLMAHVGALSLTIDEILRELADNIEKENEPKNTTN
jgi:hypothetical protein